MSRRGLIVLATSGGLLPSPSAVIVLISAVTINRVGVGLGLIAAFSVGLASTLTVIGLGLVYGRAYLDRKGDGSRSQQFVRILPVLSAVALIVAGLVVAVEGLREF